MCLCVCLCVCVCVSACACGMTVSLSLSVAGADTATGPRGAVQAAIHEANHGQERRPSMDEPVARNGHSLRAADMLTGPHGFAIFFMRCGALAVQRRGLLKRRFHGLRVGSQGDWQRQQLLRGKCPRTPWQLGLPRQLTAEEEQWRAGPAKAVRRVTASEAASGSVFLPGAQLLQASGLDEAGLHSWECRAKAAAAWNFIAVAGSGESWGDGSSEDEGDIMF